MLEVRPAQKPSGPPRPFNGGNMVLFNRRVEICGVDVPISQLMHHILALLSQKRPNGQYVAHAGSDLMEALGSDCGQNGIASQVLEFRNKVAQRLLEEAHITCERTSVIASGGPGYRLQEWISMESGTGVAACNSDLTAEADVVRSEKYSVPYESPSSGLNERQHWALSQLKQGVQLQIRHLIDRFDCSPATAKRDLSALKAADLLRFVGSARAGHYVIRK